MTYFAGYGADSALTMPVEPPLVQKPTNLTATLEQINAAIQGGINAYYGTRASIAQSKASEAIAKAQYRGDVLNANFQASTGLPSPGVLLMGGLGLAAILLLTRSGGRR